MQKHLVILLDELSTCTSSDSPWLLTYSRRTDVFYALMTINQGGNTVLNTRLKVEMSVPLWVVNGVSIRVCRHLGSGRDTVGPLWNAPLGPIDIV
jgi:hypothetical protein